MKFKAGDKVWVVCGNVTHGIFGRKAGIIMGPAANMDYCGVPRGPVPGLGLWYAIELPERPHPRGLGWVSRDDYIHPRDEEGGRASHWDAGVWRPACHPVDGEDFPCVMVPIDGEEA